MRKSLLLGAASLLVILSGGEPQALARPPVRHHRSRSAAAAAGFVRSTSSAQAQVVAAPAGSEGPAPLAGGGDWAFWGPRIRGCESGSGAGGRPNYRALNRRTGASGAYQFLDRTWGGRHGVRKAKDATPEQQEVAAYELFLRRGTQPWRSAERCWRATPPATSGTSGPLKPPAGSITTEPRSAAAPAGATPAPTPAAPSPARPAAGGTKKPPPKDRDHSSDGVSDGVGKLLPGRR